MTNKTDKQLPDILNIAIFRRDRQKLSQMKAITEEGRYESDPELIHRFATFFEHTKKEYHQALLDNGIDVDTAIKMTEKYIKQGVVLK